MIVKNIIRHWSAKVEFVCRKTFQHVNEIILRMKCDLSAIQRTPPLCIQYSMLIDSELLLFAAEIVGILSYYNDHFNISSIIT